MRSLSSGPNRTGWQPASSASHPGHGQPGTSRPSARPSASPTGPRSSRPGAAQAVAVHPGETVYTPHGEWHWHGAAESTFMTHLALSETVPDEKGPTVTWGHHVTDTEYRAAHDTLLTTHSTKSTAHAADGSAVGAARSTEPVRVPLPRGRSS